MTQSHLLGCNWVLERGEILGECTVSMENRDFESDMGMVVGALLGQNIGGTGGGVGYWGLCCGLVDTGSAERG